MHASMGSWLFFRARRAKSPCALRLRAAPLPPALGKALLLARSQRLGVLCTLVPAQPGGRSFLQTSSLDKRGRLCSEGLPRAPPSSHRFRLPAASAVGRLCVDACAFDRCTIGARSTCFAQPCLASLVRLPAPTVPDLPPLRVRIVRCAACRVRALVRCATYSQRYAPATCVSLGRAHPR